MSQLDSGGEATIEELNQEMADVSAGPFLYGAEEEQLDAYVRMQKVNFPGMREAIRRLLVTPRRQVDLPAYQIDLFEVTNRQYLQFLEATGYSPQDGGKGFLKHWLSPRRFPDWAEGFPVIWVSRDDAQAFCSWRGAHLPSEEQWEKAARGVDGRYFPWGNTGAKAETAVYDTQQSQPAGNRPLDVSPFGAYDMGGNVAEWTLTVINDQRKSRAVVRGGSFKQAASDMFTFFRRLEGVSSHRNEFTGFRCARD